MGEKLKALFTSETNVGSIFILAVIAVVAIIVLFLFYIIVKASFNFEKMSGRESHSIIKTVIIAAVPTAFGVLELMKIEVNVSDKLIIALTVAACIAVALWNLKVYGLIGGIMFSVVHIVFGVAASLGVLSLVFVAIFVIAIYFFGSGFADGSSSSGTSSVPSTVTNVATQERYHVTRGVNGESYINLNGTDAILRPDVYEGRYIDDYGNNYM